MSADRGSGRSIQACLECRKSKLKCDGMFRADSTCSRCKRRGKQCSWSVTIPGASGALGEGANEDDSINETSHMAGTSAQGMATNGIAHHGEMNAYNSDMQRRPGSSNGYGNGAMAAGATPTFQPPGLPSSSLSLSFASSAPNLAQLASGHGVIRSPPIFAAPNGTSGMISSTTLPPLRTNPSYPAHLHSPLSGTSPRSSGPTPPGSSSYRRGVPWTSGPADHVTSPRYQLTSWSRRRSRSPEPKRERLMSVETSSSRSEHHQRGAASTAPLQHLREVALLSPVAAPDKGTSGSEKDGTDAATGIRSPDQARLDAAQEEMRKLQQKQGWSRERLEAASVERRTFFEQAVAPEPEALQRLDPLENGLLDEDDVNRLFALYYDAINTQHCLLDPERDSPAEVRKKSRALFIVICAAASSCDDHPRSRQSTKLLLRNMDEAASHLILSNSKSVEVIKAVILSFLFTQKPSRVADDRCWLLVDTAVRTASELGLGHRLRNPQADVVGTDSHPIRSAERAWAIAIIMQRSLGTFTGMWALNKLDVNWDKLDAWCNCELTIPGDVQLVAYLYLRRIEHHTRSQFELIDQEKFLTLESVRVSFNALFDNWRAQWVDHPKIVKVRFTRDFLLTIGLHIQLLLNVTALRLSQGRGPNDSTRVAPPNLQDHCIDLAVGLCEHFVANFQHRAHQLCRNIVSMVTWSALALLQMDFDRGHLLALRVALLLAGEAGDELHHPNFPSFYGRWLLSLVNDLAIDASVRRADPTAATMVKSRVSTSGPSTVAHIPGDARNTPGAPDGAAAMPDSAYENVTPLSNYVNGLNLPVNGTTTPGGNMRVNGSMGERGAPTSNVGTDKLLSTMAAPLSSDPFNEAWLNQFLDSLAPASWPTAEDAAALSGSAYLY